MPDELQTFLNRLKILRSLDRHDLAAAGWSPDDRQWAIFCNATEGTFIRADDPTQAAIWAAILKRETR